MTGTRCGAAFIAGAVSEAEMDFQQARGRRGAGNGSSAPPPSSAGLTRGSSRQVGRRRRRVRLGGRIKSGHDGEGRRSAGRPVAPDRQQLKAHARFAPKTLSPPPTPPPILSPLPPRRTKSRANGLRGQDRVEGVAPSLPKFRPAGCPSRRASGKRGLSLLRFGSATRGKQRVRFRAWRRIASG